MPDRRETTVGHPTQPPRRHTRVRIRSVSSGTKLAGAGGGPREARSVFYTKLGPNAPALPGIVSGGSLDEGDGHSTPPASPMRADASTAAAAGLAGSPASSVVRPASTVSLTSVAEDTDGEGEDVSEVPDLHLPSKLGDFHGFAGYLHKGLFLVLGGCLCRSRRPI